METATRNRGQDWSDEELVELLDDEDKDGNVCELLDEADEAAVARKRFSQKTGVGISAVRQQSAWWLIMLKNRNRF